VGHTCVPSNRIDQTELRNEDGVAGFFDAMLSPPHKPRDEDPEAPDTGASGLSNFSLGSFVDSMDMQEVSHVFHPLMAPAAAVAGPATGPATGPVANPLCVSIEDELEQITWGNPLHENANGLDGLGILTSVASVATLNTLTSSTTTTTTTTTGTEPPLDAWNQMVAVHQDMPLVEAVELSADAQDMPLAEAVELLPVPPSRSAESNSYKVEDGLIVLSSPNSVTAPKRIEIFCKEFGPTNTNNKPWTRDDICFKFKDMIGHGKKCLIHDREIKSGSTWHCKGTGRVACAPCKVLKVLKQIGTNLHVGYQGGIPRMILDIATSLNLHTVDYRDLQLIFDSLKELGHDMSSCGELWAICLQNASGYLAANKRFYGCFMHPLLGRRPVSDNPEHSASKGLANLWHETKIWSAGKYVSFTQAIRYRPGGNKMEERSTYKEDVIDASTEHVKKNCSDWVSLANKSWDELKLVRDKLSKGGKKRKKSYEEEEQIPEMPVLPMP